MSIELVIFQGTSGCNLNCRYCYLPAEARRGHALMSEDVLRKACRLILPSAMLAQSATILWHAGEPLAVGHEWMERALRMIDEENIHARNLLHSIQTNATLIDERWCDIMLRHRIRLGVSCDGPEFLHNSNRVNWGGRGSFKATMKGLDHLRSKGIRYNAIAVVTEDTLEHPDEFYNFFVDNGFSSLGLNIEEIEGHNARSSLQRPQQELRDKFRAFLDRLCELWMQSDALPIREFEAISSKMVTSTTRPNYVPMQDVAQGLKIITVRSDGKIVTFSPELASGTHDDPDRFVVGSIFDCSYIEDVALSPKYRALRSDIAAGIGMCRNSCEYFSRCGGGWPSNKFFENGSFASSDTIACLYSVKSTCDTLSDKLASRPEFAASIADYMSARSH